MSASPLTYQVLDDELNQAHFLIGSGGNYWVRDRHSKDILLNHGNAFENTRIRVKETGEAVAYIKPGELDSDWFVSNILGHFGISEAQLVRTANMDAHYVLRGVHHDSNANITRQTFGAIKANDVEIHSTLRSGFDSKTYSEEASYHHLCLDPVILPEFQPRELPKVPRKMIAQLRKHVQTQWDLAKIANKVSGKILQRYDMHSHDNPIYKKALAYRDLEARGKLMTTADSTFWRFAIACYASPASLIDSCRSEFYNAAGVRPEPVVVKEEPAFVPKSTDELFDLT